MNLEETCNYLNISKNDLMILCDLNLIKHDNYIFNRDDLDSYLKNRKIDNRNRHIPLCDIEMLKNDKWEK